MSTAPSVIDKLHALLDPSLCRLTRRGRDERVFSSIDRSNEQLVFLAQGDFKVTKKTTSNKTLARLGQGIHLGALTETGARQFSPVALSVVCRTSPSLPMREDWVERARWTLCIQPARDCVWS